MIKTNQDNHMIDRIGCVYAKIEIELLGQFDRVRFVMKIRQDNDVTNCIGTVYYENKIELL